MYTETVDGLLVTTTAVVLKRFGWTTFIAPVLKQVSQTVNTEAGAYTTVNTLRMSTSRATRPRVSRSYFTASRLQFITL